jgi:hypothetical protein
MSEAAKSYTDAGRYRAVNPSGVSTRGGRGYVPRNRGVAELRCPCNFLPPPESIKGDGRSFRFPRISFIGPGLFGVLFALNGVAVTTQTGPAGAQNASVVSSYAVNRNETLTAISMKPIYAPGVTLQGSMEVERGLLTEQSGPHGRNCSVI